MSEHELASLLLRPDEAGVYKVPDHDIDALAEAAAADGIPCVRIDLRDVACKRDFLESLSSALDFPAHVARNWDALVDALGDLRRPATPGLVLLLQNTDRLRLESADDFQTGMEVLQSATAEWAERGRPCWVFVSLPDSEFRAVE
jgi:RNAse (barnase) inhibitor barstar